ncbi:aminopeptidase N-like [Heptranchias perlo]|uniref:aminopeptidase N-like n=1 Tax=Heptranchias perlo TaxID=212740 RepID=UPI00355A8C7E
MGPKSNSGFYLSRKAVVLFTLLTLALLVLSTVLAILYARLRTDRTEMIFPATREPPSTSSMPTVTGRTGLWNNTRLPSNLIPSHYQLELWPRLEPEQGELYNLIGQVNVTVMCREETEVILIHSHQLNYSGVTITATGSPLGAELRPTPDIQDTWLEPENQYLVIELDGKLQPGHEYIIQINYSGRLGEKVTGLFISHYSEWGINKTLVVSQMEATFARTAFPCFDEPAMKATFDIRLVHRPQFVALSNMPAIDVSERLEEDGTWKVTTFNTTVKMSTYLTAFAVCDYDYINTTYNDIEIRVWADKEAISNGEAEFALNITGPILTCFEEYYNVSYPLPKVEIIALPDFLPAAMENWGLLIFRKDSLLYNPKEKYTSDKSSISRIIAHELAHQWFGNLATMRWWNDLWLKEGLASYFENLGVSSIEPLVRRDDAFILQLVYHVLHSDSQSPSQPLSMKEEDVKTPFEIRKMFTDIAYSKGAFIIHMASNFMTEELLAKGLRTYLKTFSYSNAVTDDLWNHLQMAIDSQDAIQLPASIKSIMDTWTIQEGLPVITVNTSSGTITQEQYFENSVENRISNSSWFIPIFWMKNGFVQPLLWLEKKHMTYPEVKLTTDEEWILLNINISGFYRVNYDDSNWHQLSLQLNKDPSVIPVINRAQIINDAFNLAWSGHVDIGIALSTTMYLAKERNLIVWLIALEHLSDLELMIKTTYSYGIYKKYIYSRIVPFYYYLLKLINEDFNNLPNDVDIFSVFASTLRTVCRLDLRDCVDRATGLYSQWMSNPNNNTIPNDLGDIIYCEAIKAGTEKEWDFAWTIFQNHTSIQEAHNLLFAMGCSRETWILTRYLSYALDQSKITQEQSWNVFRYVAKNPIGSLLVWNFIRANWETIQTDYIDYYDLRSVFEIVAEGFSTDFELEEFELFLNSTTDEGEWSTIVEQLIKESRETFNWKKKIHTQVHNWLSEHVPED